MAKASKNSDQDAVCRTMPIFVYSYSLIVYNYKQLALDWHLIQMLIGMSESDNIWALSVRAIGCVLTCLIARGDYSCF